MAQSTKQVKILSNGFKTSGPRKVKKKTPVILHEQKHKRAETINAIAQGLADHYVGEETILAMGGYELAANTIRNSLPESKRTRSGDVGEMLAIEFLADHTSYKAPIKKLRYKSDRKMPLHGDDVIGIKRTATGKPKLLKGEIKSAKGFFPSTLQKAVDQLNSHNGRPNPSTLAFIAKRLYEMGRHGEGKVFMDIQVEGTLLDSDIEHLVFAVCANDCGATLKGVPEPSNKNIKARYCGAVIVSDHEDFIREIFEEALSAQ